MLLARAQAGLFVDEGVLGFASVTGSRAVHFRVQGEESPGARLKTELEMRGLRTRSVRIGVRRQRVIVKLLELPGSARADLGEMVAFELERHVPFPAEDMAWSWSLLPGPKTAPVNAVVAACERRVTDQAIRVLDDSRLRPLALTVACHDLLNLLVSGARPRRAVWVHRSGPDTDLLFLGGAHLHLSRTIKADEAIALAAEIAGTLALLRWDSCEALWISGDEADDLISGGALAEVGAAVTAPPYSRLAEPLVTALPAEERGSAMLALGVALGGRRSGLDLLPADLRPRRLSTGQVLTVGTLSAVAALGIALGWAQGQRDQRYLDNLNAAIRELDQEVRVVEGLKAETMQKQRLLAALAAVEEGSLRPLAALRELTEIIPGEAWVTALNLDSKGVEITGQATAANELIPLLDASRWLDRVEFTSPVTKGRDKEQFRLRAAWEAGTRGPSAPSAPLAESRSPQRAAVGSRPGASAPPLSGAPSGPGAPLSGAPSAPTRPRTLSPENVPPAATGGVPSPDPRLLPSAPGVNVPPRRSEGRGEITSPPETSRPPGATVPRPLSPAPARPAPSSGDEQED
jgi:Tfp pilus assembly protein PilN